MLNSLCWGVSALFLVAIHGQEQLSLMSVRGWLKYSAGGERQMFFFFPARGQFSPRDTLTNNRTEAIRGHSAECPAPLQSVYLHYTLAHVTLGPWPGTITPFFLLFEIPSQFILVFASFVHIPRWPSILQFSFIGCVPPYPERKNSCLKSGSHCPSLSCLPFQRTGHRKLKREREREQAKSISLSVSPHKKINIEEPLSDIFLQIKSVSVFTVKKKLQWCPCC